jgi:hypothetical protein
MICEPVLCLFSFLHVRIIRVANLTHAFYVIWIFCHDFILSLSEHAISVCDSH